MARNRRLKFAWALPALLLACGVAFGQTLYKYRGENGEWIYSDRPPADAQQVESRALSGGFSQPEVTVTDTFSGAGIEIVANNTYFAPVELELEFDRVEGVDFPHPDDPLRWIIPARSERRLIDLALQDTLVPPLVAYRFNVYPGDPATEPDAAFLYRVPFAIGTRHVITQTYPVARTHGRLDSTYAVDFEIPVGTGVVAARGGVVIDVVSNSFRGGGNRARFGDLANFVRVFHDDGTFGVYAHLNWNTIRVRPGERIAAGEYIADSGNTGFSTGPHLHFVVQRNVGGGMESLPVAFRGMNGEPVTPVTGDELTAYP